MKIDEAENKIYDLLVSDNSLRVRVRAKLSWEKSEFDELLAAIDFLIEKWSAKDTIPKYIALAFVNVYGDFSFRDGFYPDDVQYFLEDMGSALQEKATDLFS